MDWLIQKATELGVTTIIPLITHHTIVRPPPARVHGQQPRWQRVAFEAAQQCERWTVPTIDRPRSFQEFFAEPAPSRTTFFVQERAHHPGLTTVALSPKQGQEFAVVVGPEGGWSEEEVSQAATAGFTAVSLGLLILRSETAALTSLAILQSRLGALG
jgi:16S rRNA (uracil1498-N3)-methyltransferase